jgi:hypothetical protein
MKILDFPTYLATRRNHALEHATIHMLSRKYADKNLAGHSNPTGFFLFGELSTEDIRGAIDEAMSRLRAGESELAIHPGCGTNLAASMVLPMTFASVPFQGTRSTRRLLLLPVALMFAVLGYVLSKPLGPWLQRNVTTEADLGNLQVKEIIPVRKGVHRIITK